jgi:hypothetical protein
MYLIIICHENACKFTSTKQYHSSKVCFEYTIRHKKMMHNRAEFSTINPQNKIIKRKMRSSHRVAISSHVPIIFHSTEVIPYVVGK